MFNFKEMNYFLFTYLTQEFFENLICKRRKSHKPVYIHVCMYTYIYIYIYVLMSHIVLISEMNSLISSSSPYHHFICDFISKTLVIIYI